MTTQVIANSKNGLTDLLMLNVELRTKDSNVEKFRKVSEAINLNKKNKHAVAQNFGDTYIPKTIKEAKIKDRLANKLKQK